MDKQTIVLLLNELFATEGNGAYLHLVDGSDLLVTVLPKFFNLHIHIVKEYTINCETVKEVVCVPYSSVIYITLTNSENLRIIAKQYEPLKEEDMFVEFNEEI